MLRIDSLAVSAFVGLSLGMPLPSRPDAGS